jgi:homoserine O-acetyltransferase
MVRVQQKLLTSLGVRRLRTVVGGSLGGMQVLEWPLLYPDMVASIIPIATAVQHSPWCIGLNDLARQAIMLDPAWRNGDYYGHGQPARGLSLARQIAMISYRSSGSFLERFGREHVTTDATHASPRTMYQVESYLQYQGKKLVERFDANTYLTISRAMDHHDVARGRSSLEEVLSTIRIPALCIGIDSDILYPAEEQRRIAALLPLAQYRELHSPHGHDAFLMAYDQLTDHVRSFLAEVP